MASEQDLSTSQLLWLASRTRSSASWSETLGGRGQLIGGQYELDGRQRAGEGELGLLVATGREVLEQVLALARFRAELAPDQKVVAVHARGNGSNGSLVVSADAVREHAKLQRLQVTKGDVRAVYALASEWPDTMQCSEAALLEGLPASWWKLLLTSSAHYDRELLRRFRGQGRLVREVLPRVDALVPRSDRMCLSARVVSIPERPAVALSAQTAPVRAEASPVKPSSRKHTLPFGQNPELAAFALPGPAATPITRPTHADGERAAQPLVGDLHARAAEASRRLAHEQARPRDQRVYADETERDEAPVTLDVRSMIAGGLLTLALAALVFLTYTVLTTNEPQPRIMSVVLPKPVESAELPKSPAKSPVIHDGAAPETKASAPPPAIEQHTRERAISAPPERSKIKRAPAQAPIRSASRATDGPAPNVGF